MTLDREMALESAMVREGREKAQRSLRGALEGGRAAEVGPGRELVARAVAPVADAFEAWRAQLADGKAGQAPVAWPLLKAENPGVVAFIAVQTVLNQLAHRPDSPMTALALSIGMRIEDEARLGVFEDEQEGVYTWLMESLKSAWVKNYSYKRRVLHAAMARHSVEWDAWPTRSRVLVGVFLLDLIASHTDLIVLPLLRTGAKATTRTVDLSPGAREWLREAGAAAFAPPLLLPMRVAPKDWTGTAPGCGGYLKLRRPLVKLWDRAYQDELAAADMQPVLDAVNAVQRTAWRVNSDVLVTAQWFFENGGLPTDVVPTIVNEELPPKPADIATNKDARGEWSRIARGVYKRNALRTAAAISARLAIATAERFAADDAIYFPHQLDWRGRAYPMPSHLQPQGADLAKALLVFADAKPLGESGVEWLAIHVANCAGVDKVSFEDRITWTSANEPRIRACAEDPIANTWWAVDDEGQPREKAWRFLAACLEWAASCDGEAGQEAFESRLPVGQDGTANGLQHYSAMLRDPVGGRVVNLIPAEKPQDAYTEVLDVLKLKLQGMPDDQMALAWVNSGFLVRALTKRPVMTLPYGISRVGMKDQLVTDVVQPAMDAGHAPFRGADGEIKVGAACIWLANHLWGSIGETVVAARQGMDWLQKVAALTAKEDLPVYWTTPLGFPVRQAYYTTEEQRIETRLCGEMVRISLRVPTKRIDKTRQRSGIAPNFVHSMDATHLFMTVNRAAALGIDAFGMVHDSYATHACDSAALATCLREAFVEMYTKHNVLAEFAESARRVLSPKGTEAMIALPPSGGLEIDRVLYSLYFFG